MKDAWLRQLAGDALGWAFQHPEELPGLKIKRNEGDSPNFVAFTLLLQGLHSVAADAAVGRDHHHHVKIERVVHDEQNQFAPFMRMAYKVTTKWEFSKFPLAWATDMAERDTFHGDTEFESRKNVVSLRLADLVLWLVRRYVEAAMSFRPTASASSSG